MKRRRLRSKQRPPPCYDEKRESEDGHVLPLAASAAVAVGESHACEAGPAEAEIVDAANAALAEAVDNDGHENADAAIRWQLLSKYKAVQGLVAAVIREKSDEELHNISINIILDDIQAKASNKISMSELLEEKDEFVAATMSAVPKELSRRLLLAVNKPQAHARRPAQIDSQCVQKTYLLTFSNLDPSNAPTRETILETVLQAFGAAGYGSDVCVTHACVFRETHGSGQWHFHGLSALDKDPLLWCSGGRKHPPLLDAINGVLDSTAIEEKVAERFLQRWSAGKRGPCKFSDLELWPIVKELGLTADDPVLLAKLLQHGRNSGNERLLNYLFRTNNTIREKVAMCCTLESCDRVIADSQTTTWKRVTAALGRQCCCDRTWAPEAREILRNNNIEEGKLCQHLRQALMLGMQKKGDAVCFTGSGNEGKSFILKPLREIFQRVPWLPLSHHMVSDPHPFPNDHIF
ncbi:unnamed protein product [Cladocopium goreaui]|uniref:SAM domain-containing protein n=1 Tax=Cladocopium goreaui TaxID=2562237 RepID=A0A9P1DE65_9DINO|nr:unnamed protein product [Cladocopium goreaui]